MAASVGEKVSVPSPAADPGLLESPTATPTTPSLLSAQPNGGFQAWLQIAGSFCLYFNTWGLVSSFGTFQAIYETGVLSAHGQFEISIIGSLQIFLMVFLSFLTGPIFDSGYCRTLLTVGSVFVVVGTLAQSFCTNLWQFLLSQGVLVGIGAGCLNIPSVAIPSQWFTTQLPIANGIAASGSGLGGVILPIVVRRLNNQIGLRWSVRVVALILFVLLVVANVVLRPRNPSGQQKRRSLVDRTAFTDWPYVLFVMGCFVVFLGLYTPFTFGQSYALSEKIVEEGFAFYLLAILNSSSILGRILPMMAAPKLGAMNMVTITAMLLGITGLSLMAATSTARLLVVIVFYGFFAGTFFALLPTVIARSTSNPATIGTRFGMAFALFSIANLFGPPIAGALLDRLGYDAAWIWAGTVLLIGAWIQALARTTKVGWTIKHVV
ncbi:major facilitator superfamily transporter [Stachybotrys elegans]|uniref:Major facilitator superfamily transporter n=1 Tax=Stachybotrys elegans TaxID=80388 RepID=A0A8K0SGH6_9HYPO|nr:major facilitator superfamily transporter [Stachybotrys elegans]